MDDGLSRLPYSALLDIHRRWFQPRADMVLFILRSIKANRHEMDGGYSDGFIAHCLIFIAIGFNQGHAFFYLYYGQLEPTEFKWMMFKNGI